jgi:hypothetical protein
MRRTILSTLLLSALIAGAACASTSGRLYVRTGPPAPVVERRIEAPGPDFVWQPGFYRWSGNAYVWVPGRYERAPRARAKWVPGHWAHARGGYYFVEGHWR